MTEKIIRTIGKIMFAISFFTFIATGCSIDDPECNLAYLIIVAIISGVLSYVSYRMVVIKWEE